MHKALTTLNARRSDDGTEEEEASLESPEMFIVTAVLFRRRDQLQPTDQEVNFKAICYSVGPIPKTI